MNIFYLDSNPRKCAEYHIDKHCTKMILESAQLLCTALWVDNLIGYAPRALTSNELSLIKDAMRAEPSDISDRSFVPYKACHHNHPSSIWLRSSIEHYNWLTVLAFELQEEAWYRGYKTHKSYKAILNLPEPINIKNTGFLPPLKAMPEELKLTNDTIVDYRFFYLLDKATFAKWTGREKPYWWDERIAQYERRYTDLNATERKVVLDGILRRKASN